MDTNTDNTTATKEASDKDLHRQGLSTIQAVIELLKAVALKWGWSDLLVKLLALAGVIIAALLGTACTLDASQAAKIKAAHDTYHKATGRPCILNNDTGVITITESRK